MQGRLPSVSTHQVQGRQTAAGTGNHQHWHPQSEQYTAALDAQPDSLKSRRTALPSGQKQKRP